MKSANKICRSVGGEKVQCPSREKYRKGVSNPRPPKFRSECPENPNSFYTSVQSVSAMGYLNPRGSAAKRATERPMGAHARKKNQIDANFRPGCAEGVRGSTLRLQLWKRRANHARRIAVASLSGDRLCEPAKARRCRVEKSGFDP
jgi:hypothetical protein